MKKIATLFLLTFIMFSLSNCENKKEEIKAGSICTIEDGEGKFGIVKVLVINDIEAHIKLYKNKYNQRPNKVDIKTLNLGGIGDKNGFGIGHIPLDREGFDNWKPESVDFEEVTESDLYGYNLWKNE
jgi:hypothetical protein